MTSMRSGRSWHKNDPKLDDPGGHDPKQEYLGLEDLGTKMIGLERSEAWAGGRY